ncbi:MAG: ABC transporter permease subunit [Pseudonocardiaceae bacterium]|nr:ABC transporter permease subunit [Pseudonocardiaceae bacterium]
MLIVLGLSFFSWDGLDTPRWTGIDNWTRFMRDSVTHNAIWLSIKVMIFSWLLQTPISMLLGVYLAGKQRNRAVLAAVYILPLLLSAAAIGITWKSLLDPNFGLLGITGDVFGIPALRQDWLGNGDLALYVVVFVIGWQFIPFHTLLYQAATRQIPQSLYEAASIDGAGPVRKFASITFPQLRYTMVTSSTLILVGSLTYFDLVFVITHGGPGHATRILPLDMYVNGFESYHMGYASAIAVVLVLFGVAVSMLLVKLSGFTKMRSRMEGV